MATEPTKSEGLRPARRTIVKGAAWAVPAVAVASAAPASAVSVPPVAPDIEKAFGCKWPGGGNPQCDDPLDKAFRIYIPFDNNTGYPVTVTILGGRITQGGDCPRDYEPHGGTQFDIPVGGEHPFWYTWHDDNSNNSQTFTVSYSYTVHLPDGTTQVFGPYAIPVAKVFNQTCQGDPEPTIPAGPATNPCSEHSDCPGGDNEIIAEQPSVETEAPAVEEPAVEAPAAEEPAVEAPAAEEPAVEAPAVEEPAVEAPAVEEQGTVDTAEVTAAPPATDEATEDN